MLEKNWIVPRKLLILILAASICFSASRIAKSHSKGIFLLASKFLLTLFLDMVYKSPVSQINYERALASAKKELEELAALKQSTETRMTTLKQLIANLTTLQGEAVPAEFTGQGLTESCRNVLKGSGREMAPLEVRSALQSTGYDVAKYSNPLASIHAVLKRLVDADEAEAVNRGGKTLYKWKWELPGPPPQTPSAEKK